MAAFNFPLDAFYSLLLVFLRVAAVVFSMPVLDSAAIPVVFKAGLAFSVSILLLNVVAVDVNVGQLDLIPLALAIVSEIAIGVAIGLSVKLLFTGIQLAGQIAGFQMGFAVANVVDPTTSLQIPILAQFYNLTALLVFLAINAHHMFFAALVDCFNVIPPLSLPISSQVVGFMMTLAADMFVVAIKVGAPLIAVMLIVSVGMGLMARTVPQIHIFIVAMPMKILIGMAMIMVVMPYLTAYLIDLFSSYRDTLYSLIRLLAN